MVVACGGDGVDGGGGGNGGLGSGGGVIGRDSF